MALAWLLDTLLICSVITTLVVRTELYLTNHPQPMLAFVTPAARQLAAVARGLGLFIDEVGKFVTADNNDIFVSLEA